MQKLSYREKDFARKIEKLCRRPLYPPEIEPQVKQILEDVRDNGDAALRRCAKKYDGVDLPPARFAVTAQELKNAAGKIKDADRAAILAALANVTAFAEQKIPATWSFAPRPGVNVGERFMPLERVGIYIPGGAAPLVSTVIHTAGLAKAASVREIVAVTPPGRDGVIHPAVLYAMKAAGVTEIYRLGGVYGIAALAYGTQTVRKVEKIVGPGNAYVAAAKKLVYGEVAVDMVAGPSEIMIIADAEGDPSYIAADMLSQAEHGSGLEQAILLAVDAGMITEVENALRQQKARLTRSMAVEKVLADGVYLIQVKNLEQAAEIAGNYAPEHLEIFCRRPSFVAKEVKAAGAIFLGPWTPEPIGDFCAGPSHVLPTAGTAKFFSGLTVESFFRRSSIISYEQHAFVRELPVLRRFAAMEGLDAHGSSGLVRVTARSDFAAPVAGREEEEE